MKTPAVSAGGLQYKHSQGSQREVERLSGAGRGRGTWAGDRGTGSGQSGVEQALSVEFSCSIMGKTRLVITLPLCADCEACRRLRLHQCGDLQLQVLIKDAVFLLAFWSRCCII